MGNSPFGYVGAVGLGDVCISSILLSEGYIRAALNTKVGLYRPPLLDHDSRLNAQHGGNKSRSNESSA